MDWIEALKKQKTGLVIYGLQSTGIHGQQVVERH
jgi:hypothetical protein